MNNYKKGFAHAIFIIIGLLVLVVAVGGTVAVVRENSKPKTEMPVVLNNNVVNETKDWKTYRNDKYGFEFKYPSNLKVNNGDSCTNDSSISIGELYIARYNKDVTDTYEIAKIEFDKTNDKTPKSGGYVTPGYTTSEIKSSILGNYFSFVNTLSLGDGGGLGFETWPEHEALYFKVGGNNVLRAVFLTNNELYSKIISTLKVIDVSEATGSKTYTNSEYGFEFKYPGTFSVKENNSGNSPFEYEVCVSPRANGNSSQQSGQIEKYKEVIQVFVVAKSNQSQTYLNSNPPTGGLTSFLKENGDFFFKFQAYESQVEILKSISSTFKAVPIKDVIRKDWKTYVNNDYGFELKYPAYFGEFAKIDSTTWEATDYPVPSKFATLGIKVYTNISSQTLFQGIGYGETVKFDLVKKQFYTTAGRDDYKYVEKKFSNGNLYMQTSTGEGGDGWWGSSTVYLIFNEKNNHIVALSTGNNPNTYNRGPKLEEIFVTFKFTN